MELLSFDCIACDERVMWAHPEHINMTRVIMRAKSSGWHNLNLAEPVIETRFGELDVSFAGLCPECAGVVVNIFESREQ